MISLRTHVVSVLAVVMALAVGIALGSGPLSHDVETRPASSPDSDGLDALRAAQSREEALEEGTRSSDAFVSSLTDRLVRGRLADRTVTVLVLPGAAPATVDALVDTVGRAGGRVVGEVRVDARLLDVAARQLVGELGSQMAESAGGGVAVPSGAGDYERLGRLLARALLTDDRAGTEVDPTARGILAGLETAELVEVLDGADVRGSLLLAVAGTPYGDADEREGAGIIVSTLLAEAARTARAVVLAGPSGSDAADGLVGSLRRNPEVRERVSTTDAADRAAGRVAAVLALSADVPGPSGHYGVGPGTDGIRPPDPR